MFIIIQTEANIKYMNTEFRVQSILGRDVLAKTTVSTLVKQKLPKPTKALSPI